MEMVSLEEALSILDQQSELPLVESFTYLVQNCRKRKRLEYAKQLQAHICNSGLESHKALGNYVVPMFVECGSVPDAQKIFNRLVYRKESSWTALISAYFDCGESQKAFNLYQQMHNDSVRPSTYTAVALLRGCARLKDMERGQEIHAEIKQNGFEGDVFVDSTLIDMYAKCGFLAEAKEIFDRMPARGLVSWNALIAGYAEHGHSQEALKCFKQMQLEGISPDAVTYACSLKACGNVGAIDRGREIHIKVAEGEFENLPVENTLVGMYAKFGLLLDAREVFDEMLVHNAVSWTALMSGYTEHGAGQEALICLEEVVAEGILPDPVMLACVLKACCSIIAIDKGREIHNEIAQKGFEKELPVGNTLVDMYATCGLLAEAREVFDNLPNRTVVSWTALIGGYAEHGHGQEALSCLEHMHLDGVVPNVVTFVCVLKACGNIGAIEKGRELQLQIVQMGLEGDPSICISLIGVYADCGLLLEALEVFEKMPVRDVVAWSAMIRGYGMNHEGDKAVQCFEDMIEHGVKPDAITFTCLLNACSHAGREFKAQEYFKIMREDYGIVPTIEHYACMVDLLARSGNTYQAERFFEALCPASEGTWGALLSACKTYGDLELGSRCFEHLCQIVPKDAAWYVLMADIYVSAGRSSDAYRVEELRKHAGAKKKPGSASIEVNKKVHTFVVGNNKSDEITSTLKMLSLHMKDEGHMPNLDLILTPTSDVGKEEALCEHAEKLAIAFGLLNTPQGETLRVTKNLRMCNDCHGASKMISRVEKREIILRDECCVHHFKDGLCSCGDLF